MWDNQRITVIFPAYNEEENIAQAVGDFLAVPVVDEVLVVDNNSKDRTAELAKAAGARVVNETTQGYGAALQRGLREAVESSLIILAEPDGTFVANDVVKLLSYSDDFDLVCGTRTTRELVWEEANMGQFLRIGNVAVAKLIQLLFNGPSLSDCGCTLRLVRRESLEKFRAKLTVRQSHFLPEMVILALRHGLRVIEIPVNYRGRVGTSKITGNFSGAWNTGVAMIKLALEMRFRSL